MVKPNPLLSVGLPKWPALVVQGDSITREQAMEVLIRTNRWSYTCNDREWQRTVYRTADIPFIDEGYIRADYDKLDEALTRLGVLDTLEYLGNSRIASAWIGGAHGWCNWDGSVGTTNYNIGKWPSVETVMLEWKVIAKTFPFLKLWSQLWSVEAGEDGGVPVVEFVVSKGKVRLIEPRKHPSVTHGFSLDCFRPGMFGREQGCSSATLRKAVEHVRAQRSR